jgi:hypothetical protein
VVLGMFVTFTDTDNINQPNFNDDYNHKGVYMRVPLRMFLYKDQQKCLIMVYTLDKRRGADNLPLERPLQHCGELMPAILKMNQMK